jgi:predicted amidophosphoribosyltransferase
MKTVQKGLRDGDIEKDTYERLLCSDCEKNLQTDNDPSELGTVRRCPECGREFKELRT